MAHRPVDALLIASREGEVVVLVVRALLLGRRAKAGEVGGGGARWMRTPPPPPHTRGKECEGADGRDRGGEDCGAS
jgi:hypothetical protein